MQKLLTIFSSFLVPFIILGGMIIYGILLLFHFTLVANLVIILVTLLGSYGLIKETIISLMHKQFGLDYIAILAIGVGLGTEQFLVAAILALMVSGGRNLEEYGVKQAKKSLTALVDRIPSDITLWEGNAPGKKENIRRIRVGTHIFIHKGEVIGLDGTLVSQIAEVDESSLTGEPYFLEKETGDTIRSGTINVGQPIVIAVTKEEKDSTYKKIVRMVQEAQEEKSPFIRLADQYSTLFTLTTFVIAGVAFCISRYDLSRVLAVLAVATPCPLIIATPIALLGGVNASAKRKIIVKKLAALEVLAQIKSILFDKTGTITLGTPRLTDVEILDSSYTQSQILHIAQAIERNSLHPLAKALVQKAQILSGKKLHAHDVEEIIGKGISGIIDDKQYFLSRLDEPGGMAIALFQGKKHVATFHFQDEIKQQSRQTINDLTAHGLSLEMLTGDKKEAAEKIVALLGIPMRIKAECSPEDKQQEIEKYKKQGPTAMVGDGINDAPALALADVGLAFSNQEQTAASEAADIVFLGGNFSMVLDSLHIAKRTIAIAKQSIFVGIGLSIAAMLFAATGNLPPIFGAGLQEAIDVAVILNALRTSR